MEKKVQVWHNNSCSKSNCASEWLHEKGIEAEFFDYLHQTISYDELLGVLAKLAYHPFDLIRKNEPEFNEHWNKEEKSEKEWIDLMIKHPNWIQRPIVIVGDRAIVARPLEKIEILF